MKPLFAVALLALIAAPICQAEDANELTDSVAALMPVPDAATSSEADAPVETAESDPHDCGCQVPTAQEAIRLVVAMQGEDSKGGDAGEPIISKPPKDYVFKTPIPSNWKGPRFNDGPVRTDSNANCLKQWQQSKAEIKKMKTDPKYQLGPGASESLKEAWKRVIEVAEKTADERYLVCTGQEPFPKPNAPKANESGENIVRSAVPSYCNEPDYGCGYYCNWGCCQGRAMECYCQECMADGCDDPACQNTCGCGGQ